MSRSLVRNISWLGAANIAVKPLWFVFITAGCMRILGEESYGLLTASLALAAVSGSFVDMGMSRYVARHLSQNRTDQSPIMSSLWAARLALSAVSFVACIGLGRLLGFSGQDTWTLLGAATYSLLLNLVVFLRVPYQAFEDLRAEAISLLVEKAAVVGFGLVALLATARADVTAFAMSAGMLLALFHARQSVTTRFVRISAADVDVSVVQASFKAMFLLGVASIIGGIYPRIDLLMVKSMLGDAFAGNYSAAYRFLEAVLFVPAIVSTSALYPRYAKLFSERKYAEAGHLVRRTVMFMGAAGIAICAVLFVLSDFLLGLMSSSDTFLGAPVALRWLAFTIPLTFVSSVTFSAMLAMNDERWLSIMLFVLTVVNIGLNFWLIPTNGIIGATVATIATETIMVVAYAIRFRVLSRRFGTAEHDQVVE